MTGNKGWFCEINESFRHTVKLGNNSKLAVMGKGNIIFEVEGITQLISDVFFVPELSNNLLSIGQLQEKGVDIHIKGGMCKVYQTQRGLIMNTRMSANRLFIVFAFRKPLSSKCMKVEGGEVENLWHKRYGHLNNKAIHTMQYKGMVKGLPQLKSADGVCEVCNVGKQHREIISKRSKWRASEQLQLVHADLCGPISPTSHSGKRYMLVLIDDFSRKTWIYFLTEKGETFDMFKRFKSRVEKEVRKYI